MISKSYQDVRVGTREAESLETLSEDHEWLCRCDVVHWSHQLSALQCCRMEPVYNWYVIFFLLVTC